MGGAGGQQPGPGVEEALVLVGDEVGRVGGLRTELRLEAGDDVGVVLRRRQHHHVLEHVFDNSALSRS
jgi:hypothetical protein